MSHTFKWCVDKNKLKTLDKRVNCIKIDGSRRWGLNGKLHRENGPAIEQLNGDKVWYLNGELHRVDGPAIDVGGDKVWYLNGELHRVDGPAVEYASGLKAQLS